LSGYASVLLHLEAYEAYIRRDDDVTLHSPSSTTTSTTTSTTPTR